MAEPTRIRCARQPWHYRCLNLCLCSRYTIFDWRSNDPGRCGNVFFFLLFGLLHAMRQRQLRWPSNLNETRAHCVHSKIEQMTKETTCHLNVAAAAAAAAFPFSRFVWKRRFYLFYLDKNTKSCFYPDEEIKPSSPPQTAYLDADLFVTSNAQIAKHPMKIHGRLASAIYMHRYIGSGGL